MAVGGRTGVRPGTVIKLDGVGKRFSGQYYVRRRTGTRPAGYQTQFRCGGTLMSMLGALLDGQEDRAAASRIFGVVVGIVTNNQDPEGLGRVKVKIPCLSDVDESFWARVAAPMAGKRRGTYFLPEVDDEVLVAFEHGDVRFPYVLGALWNGKMPRPSTNNDGKNNVRMIKSRSGHVVKLNDEDGKETIEIVDKSSEKQHRDRHRQEHHHRDDGQGHHVVGVAGHHQAERAEGGDQVLERDQAEGQRQHER